MREFKRSLQTNDPKLAKRRHAAAALEYEDFLEGLKTKATASSQPSEGGPVTIAPLSPAATHELAGELYRWVLTEHAAQPAPPEAFSNIAPDGAWGKRAEPWAGQRYQLVQARNARFAASKQRMVHSNATSAWPAA